MRLRFCDADFFGLTQLGVEVSRVIILLIEIILILLKALDFTIQFFPLAFESFDLLPQVFKMSLRVCLELFGSFLLIGFVGFLDFCCSSLGLLNRPLGFACGLFFDSLDFLWVDPGQVGLLFGQRFNPGHFFSINYSIPFKLQLRVGAAFGVLLVHQRINHLFQTIESLFE